jgi:hypothetical protein
MAVIINDFEVVVEPEATPAGGQSPEPIAREEGVAPQTLTPHDFDNILRRCNDRLMRIRAH